MLNEVALYILLVTYNYPDPAHAVDLNPVTLDVCMKEAAKLQKLSNHDGRNYLCKGVSDVKNRGYFRMDEAG